MIHITVKPYKNLVIKDINAKHNVCVGSTLKMY